MLCLFLLLSQDIRAVNSAFRYCLPKSTCSKLRF